MRKHVSIAELPELVTPDEARAVLRIGRTSLYELIRTGRLPATRLGRQLRISRAVLERITKGETP